MWSHFSKYKVCMFKCSFIYLQFVHFSSQWRAHTLCKLPHTPCMTLQSCSCSPAHYRWHLLLYLVPPCPHTAVFCLKGSSTNLQTCHPTFCCFLSKPTQDQELCRSPLWNFCCLQSASLLSVPFQFYWHQLIRTKHMWDVTKFNILVSTNLQLNHNINSAYSKV